ncbi:MAG: helix-turn-helix transcriptional regulator [Planctomycetota bacterium]
MAKKKAQRKRSRGPNRSIDVRIAELQAEIDKLKSRKEGSKVFSAGAVKKHRAQLELSAADYALLVDVAPLTIYNWEHGRTKPQAAQLERWLDVKSMSRADAWKKLGY